MKTATKIVIVAGMALVALTLFVGVRVAHREGEISDKPLAPKIDSVKPSSVPNRTAEPSSRTVSDGRKVVSQAVKVSSGPTQPVKSKIDSNDSISTPTPAPCRRKALRKTRQSPPKTLRRYVRSLLRNANGTTPE